MNENTLPIVEPTIDYTKVRNYDLTYQQRQQTN